MSRKTVKNEESATDSDEFAEKVKAQILFARQIIIDQLLLNLSGKAGKHEKNVRELKHLLNGYGITGTPWSNNYTVIVREAMEKTPRIVAPRNS